jgi:protease I
LRPSLAARNLLHALCDQCLQEERRAFMNDKIKGLRVAVLAADGFEQVELTKPLKALQRAGAVAEVISLRKGQIKGMNLLAPGRKIKVDRVIDEAEPGLYEALLLPGGHINPDFLRQNEQVLAFVRAFDMAGKPIAVICHGPWVLVSAGLVAGRRLTSWPAIKDDIVNAGGMWEDAAVVRDRNWVSSRGPQDLAAFEQAMLTLFSEHSPLRPHSDLESQRRGGGMKWLFGGLLAIGAGLSYLYSRMRDQKHAAPLARNLGAEHQTPPNQAFTSKPPLGPEPF